MADYRDLSQAYAQGAIKAFFLLNGGSGVALLSQAAALSKIGMGPGMRVAMLSWAVGTAAAASAWACGFLSTRHVDKSEREPQRSQENLQISDSWMFGGIGLVVVSLLSFLFGTVFLAASFD